MKIIITGATGMVGKGVLLECLDHKDITEVLSISRRRLEISHPKLKELLHKDFSV
jgi:dTDP-4-dehydrorhamnose reductase